MNACKKSGLNQSPSSPFNYSAKKLGMTSYTSERKIKTVGLIDLPDNGGNMRPPTTPARPNRASDIADKDQVRKLKRNLSKDDIVKLTPAVC